MTPKRYFSLALTFMLLVGCAADTADAGRFRARVRAWITTSRLAVRTRHVVPNVQPIPDTGDNTWSVSDSPNILYQPPLSEVPSPQSSSPATQSSDSSANNVAKNSLQSSCPNGQCARPVAVPMRTWGIFRRR